MGRDYKRGKGGSGRDAGGFVALPWVVLDSEAYMGLSHPAKALLLELARQLRPDNNGRLLASMNHLRPRGWTSYDVITRAVRELMSAGLIHQTVQGCRPSKASWYAVTWMALERGIQGYDHGAVESFQRGAYRQKQPLKITPLTPPPGVGGASTAPSPGVGRGRSTPSPGAVEGVFGTSSTPSPGDHLDKPSTAQQSEQGQGRGKGARTAEKTGETIVAPTTEEQPRAIETLAELWGKVGSRSCWVTRIPTCKDTARAAMAQAVARKRLSRPTPPAVATDDDGWTRTRDDAQDVGAWDA